ncbi:hypothetical protein RAB80_014798 [Fusarium oxysporum f. sp. vasinfectum]|nr:hypothetical protein RAB80_014798 [Fusarium oxysporum f. sp. vasinfectum]
MKSIVASALLFLGFTSAQYGGQIKVKDDGCPQFTAGEKSQPLSWVKGNNICADLSDICPPWQMLHGIPSPRDRHRQQNACQDGSLSYR